MTDITPPKIELTFPCEYPLKVVAIARENIDETIVSLLETYEIKLDPATFTRNPSRNGNYISISLILPNVTSRGQLERICQALRDEPDVMTLL